jgi:branched-chain amino acid transport system permease protein
LIQALHLPRLHLVGHSLGACIALEYALAHSDRIKTLTLVAPAPAEGRSVLKLVDNGNGFATTSDAIYKALRLSDRLGTTRVTLERALARLLPADQITFNFETLVDDAVRMSHHAVAGHIQTLKTWDVRGNLNTLHRPVLIIGGANDPLVDPKALEAVSRMLPKSRLIIWPGAGHVPQLEHPRRFIRIWAKFAAQNTTLKICRHFNRRQKVD